MGKKRKIFSIILVIAMMSTLTYVQPQKEVKAANVYYIRTIADLYSINNDMYGTYYLMNDIDMSEATAEGGDWNYMGNGWEPIGSNGEYDDYREFRGIFDGNGYTIHGMYIDIKTIPSGCSYELYIGLFACNRGTIKNLNMEDVSINTEKSVGEGRSFYCGAIAGSSLGDYGKESNITNCHVSGAINMSSEYYSETTKYVSIGGIVGMNNMYTVVDISDGSYSQEDSVISGCVSEVEIDADLEDHDLYTGGIAGKNGGTIENCCNKGNITAKSMRPDYVMAGGIVGSGIGSEYNIEKISSCYNTGNVNSYSYYSSKYVTSDDYKDYAGGIIGFNGGAEGSYKNRYIENCYNTGNVSASDFAGGIAGGQANGIVKTSYSLGDVTVERGYAYGIARGESGSNSVTNCYYKSGSGASQSGAKALTKAQMEIKSMFSNFDFTNVWIMANATEYKCPQLRNNRQANLKEIQTVELYSKPDKLNYYMGDELSLEGGAIKAYYIDGSSEIIDMTDEMITGFSSTTVGNKTVKVSFRDYSVSFLIVVEQKPNLIGVNLLSTPTKTEFVYQTEFDFSGCQVQLAYENGMVETINVTPEMTTGGDINKIGTQTIKYTNGSKSVSFDIQVIPIQTERIEIVTKPSKINYIENQSFNESGLSVKAYYNNGTNAVVEDYEISGYESTVGTHTITVTYSGVSATFDVYVREAEVTSIKVTSNPKKTEYIQGQSIDATGMVVTAYYDNGTSKAITDYTVEALGETTGFQTIAVNYGELKAYITVTVIARQVEEIAIKELPNQISYIEETEFDSTGMVVTATFNDGITEEITDYTISEVSTKELGEKVVTILYGGKSVTFNIYVVAKTLESITVEIPNDLSYLEGDEFDTSKIEVIAHYNNKKSEIISDYSISGYTGEVGSNVITVEFGGKTTNFYVKVHKLEDEWSVIKESDCENKGERVKYCSDCREIILREEISELGHTEVTDKAVEATCMEPGLTEGLHCSACEEVLVEQTVVPAKGHSPSEEWSVISNPMCVDTGLQVRSCTECGETVERKIIDEKGHNIVIDNAVIATCTTSGLTEGSHCDTCNEIFVAQKVVEAKGHTPSAEWTVTKEATCSKAGERVKYCTVCNEIVEKEVIEALGHSYKTYISDENATCTEDGTKTSKCERCESTNTVIDEASSLGHHIVLDKSVPATCAESGLTEGSHCDVCGETIRKQQVVEPKGHNASTVWSCELEATCTEKGQEVIRCIECDEVLDTRKTEAKGHSFKVYTSDENATCTEDGTKTSKCERCEATDTVIDESSAKGHSKVIDKAVSATCTKAGRTEGSHCVTCGITLVEQKNVDKIEHVTSIKNITSATYLNAGYTGDETCDKCGQVFKKGQTIPKLILNKPNLKLQAKKGKIKAKVNKVQGAQYYEYKIKIGKKWKKYVTKKNTYTFKKLKKGKKYTVKVRAYIVTDGKNVYSKWSKTKKKKITK